ncbi:MAG: hypothetical protein ACLFMZ_04805 [Spirochaetaceae bacterium]
MLVLENKTKKKVEDILNEARSFFGPQGEGLSLISEQDCCITFEGGGGHITISITGQEAHNNIVEVESKEWDYQAKQFLGRL